MDTFVVGAIKLPLNPNEARLSIQMELDAPISISQFLVRCQFAQQDRNMRQLFGGNVLERRGYALWKLQRF